MRNILTILSLICVINVFGQIGEKNFIDQNYIEVTGKAEMQIVPDLIYLKIALSEKDSKNKISVAEMERKMIDKFVEMGIDVKKDLAVNDLLSLYRTKFISKSDVILSKEYQLVVHDARTATKIFVELEKIDISNVSVDRLDHSKIEEFRRETKINAIKAARDKAEALAKAINQAIGRALYVKENEFNFSNRLSNVYLKTSNALEYQAKEQATKEVDFDLEKIDLDYSILVRFELK